jgi:hypothetical protein
MGECITINGTDYIITARRSLDEMTANQPILANAMRRLNQTAEVTLCKAQRGTILHSARQYADGRYTTPIQLRRRVDGSGIR